MRRRFFCDVEHRIIQVPLGLLSVLMALWMNCAAAQTVADEDFRGTSGIVETCGFGEIEPQPVYKLMVSAAFAQTIEQVRQCLADGNRRCATRLLAEVDDANLTTEEQGVFALDSGDTEYLRGRMRGALERYQDGLKSGVEGPMRQTLAQRIARLHLEAGEFPAALRVLDAEFDCRTWSADALIQRAIAYRGIFALAHSLDSFRAAARLYELEGGALPQDIAEAEASTRALFSRLEHLSRTPSPDAEQVAISKVAPVYPVKAMRRMLDGWVEVEYTVNDLGKVEDVRVVESSDPIFDQAAIDATAQSVYTPRLENGLPVSVPGVQVTVSFYLEP